MSYYLKIGEKEDGELIVSFFNLKPEGTIYYRNQGRYVPAKNVRIVELTKEKLEVLVKNEN